MSDKINYNQCPVCESGNIKVQLKAKDNTVSKETFEIWSCNNCTARFTQSIPDAEHIGKYYQSSEYISHTDTKKGVVNRLYHLVRSYTLSTKRSLLQNVAIKKTGNLLDVGAGTGAFANYMNKKGWYVTGLEPDSTAINNAKNNYGIDLLPSDELFSLPPNSFDVITLWHVLEHIHHLHDYVNAFYKLLKQDGVLIIALPNYTSKDAKHYQQYWAAYDVPRHLYHFSPKSIKALMQQHGFKITEYKPMWFDSFYVSMLSEQYKSGKNNIIKAFYNGFVSNVKAAKNTKNCSSVIYVVKKQFETNR